MQPSSPGVPVPSESPDLLSLTKAYRIAYSIGLALCLAWPLALQLMLGTAIHPGSLAPPGLAQQLGYSFTGLTVLAALGVTWRWGRVRAAFRRTPAEQRPAIVTRETLMYAALFELSSVYGILTYALGGPLAERYARSFIALTSIMFFVFVPRLDAWRDAAQGE